MSKISIGILDSNQSYAKRLTRYIVQNHQEKYSASYFTNMEGMNNYLNMGLTLDILLVGDGLTEELGQISGVNARAVLSEDQPNDPEGNIINKYQSAERILDEVLKCIVKSGSRKYSFNNGDRRTKVVSFYSPIGGSGNTTISLAAAASYAGKGKKVLYMSFEDIESMSAFLDIKEEDNLSELIYYIKEGDQNMKLKMDIIKKKDTITGLDFISPFNSCIDKMEVTPEDMENLMIALRELKEYDYVIIDTDNTISKETVAVIKESDIMVVSLTEDEISKVKAKNMAREFQRISSLFGINDMDDKIKLIVNKERRGTMKAFKMVLNDSEIPVDYTIPFMGEVVVRDGVKLSLKEDLLRAINRLEL